MRIIDTHKANPANDKLRLAVMDAPGAGGASHRYEITGFDSRHNPSGEVTDRWSNLAILFQNGPIAEHGVNGITQEVLLAIVIDRLECFQAGAYACHENDMARIHAVKALDWLKERTYKRMERGVEGTNEK